MPMHYSNQDLENVPIDDAGAVVKERGGCGKRKALDDKPALQQPSKKQKNMEVNADEKNMEKVPSAQKEDDKLPLDIEFLECPCHEYPPDLSPDVLEFMLSIRRMAKPHPVPEPEPEPCPPVEPRVSDYEPLSFEMLPEYNYFSSSGGSSSSSEDLESPSKAEETETTSPTPSDAVTVEDNTTSLKK